MHAGQTSQHLLHASCAPGNQLQTHTLTLMIGLSLFGTLVTKHIDNQVFSKMRKQAESNTPASLNRELLHFTLSFTTGTFLRDCSRLVLSGHFSIRDQWRLPQAKQCDPLHKTRINCWGQGANTHIRGDSDGMQCFLHITSTKIPHAHYFWVSIAMKKFYCALKWRDRYICSLRSRCCRTFWMQASSCKRKTSSYITSKPAVYLCCCLIIYECYSWVYKTVFSLRERIEGAEADDGTPHGAVWEQWGRDVGAMHHSAAAALLQHCSLGVLANRTSGCRWQGHTLQQLIKVQQTQRGQI